LWKGLFYRKVVGKLFTPKMGVGKNKGRRDGSEYFEEGEYIAKD